MLALSTFSWNRELKVCDISRVNEYEYSDSNGKVTNVHGGYQLEPVPALLVKQGVPLDQVIILTTGATERAVEVMTIKDVEELSPLEYFSRYIEELYIETKCGVPKIVSVSVDEHKPALAIQRAAGILQEIAKDNDIKLYVDNHGGFRSVQLLVEAIINLLKNEHMEVEFYNVFFENKKGKIVKDEANRIFDFVSGINEFTNYGRIDSLFKYLDKEQNKDLLDPLTEIAEGIQWCDISSFELGLKHLKNYYRSDKKSVSNIYLKIFEEHIKSDYDKLLESSEMDAVEVARWCMRKGFYQQALTVIESRMAETLMKRNIIGITNEGNEFKKAHSLHSGENMLTDTDVFNGCIFCYEAKVYWWEKKNNQTQFNQFFQTAVSLKDRELFYQFIESKSPYKEDYKSLVESIKKCSIRDNEKDECNETLEVFRGNNISEKNYKKLALMFFLHKTIKDIRNKANHAISRNSYRQEPVKNAINLYLDLIDELTINNKKIEK